MSNVANNCYRNSNQSLQNLPILSSRNNKNQNHQQVYNKIYNSKNKQISNKTSLKANKSKVPHQSKTSNPTPNNPNLPNHQIQNYPPPPHCLKNNSISPS
jgi:hypothetical protein